MVAQIKIAHLFELTQHREAAAKLIFDEFWTDVPDYSVDKMAQRLRLATQQVRLPVSMVAVENFEVVGAVNLVDDDGNGPPDGAVWLAGMVVALRRRHVGIGTLLVQSVLAHAARMGCDAVYLGTDGPNFYARLGATIVEQRKPDFWIMKFGLPSATLHVD